MDKPEKPDAKLPNSFGGTKEPFSVDRIKNGFEPDVPQIFEGSNLNDWLDKTGKNFEYIEKIVDFVNNLPINNLITTDENNKLVYFDKSKIGTSIPLFSTLLVDHMLQGDEAIGWALQGSLVTKVYPDAVNEIILLYKAGNETTYRGITCRVLHPDGRYIADISQKENIDNLYNSTGVADFYILDLTNEQFYLPKNKWFIQPTDDLTKLNQYNPAGLPNITGSFTADNGINVNGCFYRSGDYGSGYTNDSNGQWTTFNASRSSSVYGNSDTVQPPSSNKLLYYKVGNTVVNEAMIDVGNVLNDLQNKADISALNFTNAGRSLLSGLGMPSDRYIDLSLGKSGSKYIAPANGYFYVAKKGNLGQYISLRDNTNKILAISPRAAGSMCYLEYAVTKGTEVTCIYDLSLETTVFRFYYSQGAQE